MNTSNLPERVQSQFKGGCFYHEAKKILTLTGPYDDLLQFLVHQKNYPSLSVYVIPDPDDN